MKPITVAYHLVGVICLALVIIGIDLRARQRRYLPVDIWGSAIASAATEQSGGSNRPCYAGKVVCIDAGHPSELNSGRTVQHGVTEVAMNWRVAQRLIHLLQVDGVVVVSTKQSEEEFVSNRQRAEIANRHGAAIMLLLHCDTGRGSGIAFYYPNRQGRKYGMTGPSRDIITASAHAAKLIHAAALSTLGSSLHDNGIKGESATLVGSKQGALTGSIFSKVPAVTVEMVTLSNAGDAEFIRGEHGQQLMATALEQGLIAYLTAICGAHR